MRLHGKPKNFAYNKTAEIIKHKIMASDTYKQQATPQQGQRWPIETNTLSHSVLIVLL